VLVGPGGTVRVEPGVEVVEAEVVDVGDPTAVDEVGETAAAVDVLEPVDSSDELLHPATTPDRSTARTGTSLRFLTPTRWSLAAST
jgi:hypothetical protein